MFLSPTPTSRNRNLTNEEENQYFKKISILLKLSMVKIGLLKYL